MSEKTETSFYTEILSEKIALLITREWGPEDAYTISGIAEMFDIDIRLARYYLMKFVTQGYLCQITWEGNTYYALRYWKGPFMQLGVKVI